jgi:hypothetical protein
VCGVFAAQDKELRDKFFYLSSILMCGYLALETPPTSKKPNGRYTHISSVRPEETLHNPEKAKGSR